MLVPYEEEKYRPKSNKKSEHLFKKYTSKEL